ncbi:hypothetical protein HKX48_001899 [Thoreauomyces humboldtii]|nr:hypothetical protein HKX48_001899 [Thoreauomyces humboldtii]
MAVMGLLEDDHAQEAGTPVDDPALTAESTSLRKPLLAILMTKNNTSIWDAAGKKEAAFFHVTVLDKTHLFPPRRPTSRTAPVQHSTLSPLNPASPLHPDGLMAPAWVQRHKESRPSVVVGFFDLWETGADGNRDSVLGGQQAINLERERDLILCSEIMEKKQNCTDRGIKFAVVIMLRQTKADDMRVDDRIGLIRRNCSLDLKSSLFVLSAKTSNLQQFVATMQKTLYEQASLYYREHDKRVRRKKARIPPLAAPASRSALSPVSAATPAPVPGSARPLPPAGWHLRYEYKLGVFAEFRQDVEAAIRHYETTYQLLLELMQAALAPTIGGSGTVDFLQPFTARWTEAKTLADCVNLKICKLHLYSERPVPALQQLERHVAGSRGFPEYLGRPSAGEPLKVSPGISRLGNVAGGGSFEYWAWVSTQYRIFGELIELATGKSGLRLPFPPPGQVPPQAATPHAHSFLNTVTTTGINVLTGGDAAVPVAPQFGLFSSINPALVVQHSGYYYFIAASCAEERWKRFRDAQKTATFAPPPPPSAAFAAPGGRVGRSIDHGSSPFSPLVGANSPYAQSLEQALQKEDSVDHATFVIELLTKSYEQFKKQRAGRMTLFLASEIARVYEASGKHEMALKFYERIAKTYRKEHWPSVLKDVLRESKECARVLSRWDVVAECLVELLGERMGTIEERQEVLTELMGVVSSGEGIKVAVDMDQLDGFLQCSVQFRKHSTYVGVEAPFQVCLKAEAGKSPPVPITISRVHVQFSDQRFDHVLVDEEGSRQGSARAVRLLNCTDCKFAAVSDDGGREAWVKHADLEFHPGMTQILEGAVVPTEGMELKILAVNVVLASGNGTVTLSYKISDRPDDLTSRRKWYLPDDAPTRWTMLDGSGEQSTMRVIRRQSNLAIRLRHAPPGLVDEVYPVDVDVVNEEPDGVEAFLDVEFRSSGADSKDPTSRIGESEDGPPCNGIDLLHLGVIPGHATVTRRFYLRCLGTPGERVMYNIVNYRSVTSSNPATEQATPATHPDLFFRKNEPARISFAAPFEMRFTERDDYGHPFETGEAGLFSTLGIGEPMQMKIERTVGVRVECPGPWEIEVQTLTFVNCEEKWKECPGVQDLHINPVGASATQGQEMSGTNESVAAPTEL